MSIHGIYGPVEIAGAVLRTLPEEPEPAVEATEPDGTSALLHPKYKIPASCFAYVADANDTGTWKLPYRLAGGAVNPKRLPKAIQCIISNYRGATVSGIPEGAIPDMLVRLARAAASVGRMPGLGSAVVPLDVAGAGGDADDQAAC